MTINSNSESIITPEQFKLPKLAENVFLFFLLHHFFMFRELVDGGKVGSYGPVKRFTFRRAGTDYTALGGFIGAPLAVIIAENAMVSGAKAFKAFGTAGCIGSDSIEIGEIHRPSKGLDETGMIHDYGGSTNRTEFSYAQSEPGCHTIVSVNSFYRLTVQNLERYRTQAVDLIDMEAVPLNHVITTKGATFQPLFVISDKVNPDLNWQYENRGSRLNAIIEKALQQLL